MNFQTHVKKWIKLYRILVSQSGWLWGLFWGITPCSPFKSTDVSEKHVAQANSFLPASRWFLACLILRSWRWKWHVPPKSPCISMLGISTKIRLFENRTPSPFSVIFFLRRPCSCPLVSNIPNYKKDNSFSRYISVEARLTQSIPWLC
jgi:hypothetical protein